MDFKFGSSASILFGTTEVDEDGSKAKFEDLPLELHIKILSYVDLTDVLSYSTTCKLFYRNSDSQQLW